MSRFYKLWFIHIAGVVAIFIDIAIALTVSLIIVYCFNLNDLLESLLFIISTTIVSLLLGFITNFLFERILIKFERKNDVCHINFKLEECKLDSFQANANSKVFYMIRRHLRTISFHECKNMNLVDLKNTRKLCNKIIKSKFKEAKENYARNPHWLYQVNIFVVNDPLDSKIVDDLVIKLNNNQIYEIGKINFIYNAIVNVLLIKSFETTKSDLSGFFRYRKMIKFLCKSFDINYCDIFKKL